MDGRKEKYGDIWIRDIDCFDDIVAGLRHIDLVPDASSKIHAFRGCDFFRYNILSFRSDTDRIPICPSFKNQE